MSNIDLIYQELQRKRKRTAGADPWMVAQGLANPENLMNRGSFSPSGPGAGGNAPVGGGGSPYSPATVTVPGHTPDYNALIAAELSGLKSHNTAASIADRAGLGQAIQRALVSLGEVPDNLTPAIQGFVSPETVTLAQKNTEAGLSIAARIRQAFDDAKRRGLNALGERGAHRSGELGHFLEQQQRGFTQANYDAHQQILDTAFNYWSQFTSAERARQLAEVTAATAAAQNQAKLNPATPAQTLTWDDDAVTWRYADGRPVPRSQWPNEQTPTPPVSRSFQPENTGGGSLIEQVRSAPDSASRLALQRLQRTDPGIF